MTNTTDSTTALAEALTRLDRARALRDALAPLARLITEADEEARAAAIAAAAAGMSERATAAKLGVAQPTVHTWLDGRNAAPMPTPTISGRVWLLHSAARTVETIVHRLEGEQLPRQHSGTQSPLSRIVNARRSLGEAAFYLAEAGSNLEQLGS
ncbi:helix-turn-helix domain-containing protein [Micromonospora sp. NPDC047753]|uniref:helix-turn-helix domain-containing protein n=1 Tax=Micromonospora sp. NPDC047753 TaxID=3154817 RepID=UPI00340B478A